MPTKTRNCKPALYTLKNIFIISLLFCACTVPRKYQKNKPILTKNNIEVIGSHLSGPEKTALKQRLNAQLDDSSKIKIKDAFFVMHFIMRPPAYDSAASGRSARNMQASMLHIGYYKALASYKADTLKNNRPPHVQVHYTVETGKPTLIDTVSYQLRLPDLQELNRKNMDEQLLIVGKPVTKSAVQGEVNRLVELYRNNGYYKFSSEELKVKGDTTISALTTITDDIFEQLQLLAQAKNAKDSPKIKLAIVLNPPADSSKLTKFHIGKIIILPDYQPGDSLNNPILIEHITRNFTQYYRKKLFRTGFLNRNMLIKRGETYKQDVFLKTLNNFSKAGVWQSVNMQILERKDSLDMILQLIPGKKKGFEASLETSYSANSNSNSATVANAGNLLGVSANLAFLNRNVHKEAIKMSNSVRAGIELNLKPDSNGHRNIINSNEFSYSNSIVIPRFIWPIRKVDSKRFLNSETFFNTNLAYVKRFNLFDMQSVNFSMGYDWNKKARKISKPNKQWVWKPINIEFNRLYNKTATFDSTLQANPFLRYSFNTALVAGLGLGSLGYSYTKVNPKNLNRQHTIKINMEESGLLLGRTNILNKYLRQFIKADVEYTYSVARPKSAIVMRLFGGVGVPFKKDTTLPFFKQYFGGGSNSMRGWPVRGIGRGSQAMSPFGNESFNDRTGDVQLEGNIEYRYDIAQLIPNSLVLKGALFLDAGNIWNFRNSKSTGETDSTQFKFQNIYKQLGVAAGAGFRLDFSYFVLRFDLGFRFKRPDIVVNDGWQFPNITFNNLFKRGEKVPDPANPGQTKNDDRYRKWRYENFNFTVGISYPF